MSKLLLFHTLLECNKMNITKAVLELVLLLFLLKIKLQKHNTTTNTTTNTKPRNSATSTTTNQDLTSFHYWPRFAYNVALLVHRISVASSSCKRFIVTMMTINSSCKTRTFIINLLNYRISIDLILSCNNVLRINIINN